MKTSIENSKTLGHSENKPLIRDLSLSPDLPLVFCIRLLLQEIEWTGSINEIANLIGRDPEEMDLVDARNLFLRLGYNSQLKNLKDFKSINIHTLPALYIDPSNQPFVLFTENQGLIVAGNAKGRFDINNIEPGGLLLILDEINSNDEVSIIKNIAYRFSNKISLLYWISLGISLLALSLPLYLRAIYNIAIPGEALISSLLLFFGIGALFILEFNMRLWRSNLISQMAGKLDSLFGMKVTQKFLGLDYSQIKSINLSNYNTRIRNLDAMLNYLKGPLALALLDFPFIIIYLIAIGLIAGNLVFVPIIIMLISGSIIVVLSKYYSGAEELNIKTSVGILQAQLEIVRRFKEIKLSHLELIWIQRIRALSGESTKSGLVLNKQAGVLQILTSTSSQMAGTLTLAVGAWIMFTSPAGNNVLGNLIAAMFIVWRVFTPFQYLMNALLRFDTISKQYGQLDRFLKLRNYSPVARPTVNTKSSLYGSIQLDSISCRIPTTSRLLLAKIDLRFVPSTIYAITGKSGCGKSTLLNVIAQLYPIANGNLSFDGKDYRQFTNEDIQSNISYVMNNSQFLKGSLWQNLTAMNPDASIDAVKEICEMIGIYDYIENLPEGFDTYLDNDMSYYFPVGVQKLMSFAQALIKDSPILLIDDISQGLTPIQFEAVVNALPRIKQCRFSRQERCIIMTTSNNKMLELADNICIIDKGVSTFQGTQKELEMMVHSKT